MAEIYNWTFSQNIFINIASLMFPLAIYLKLWKHSIGTFLLVTFAFISAIVSGGICNDNIAEALYIINTVIIVIAVTRAVMLHTYENRGMQYIHQHKKENQKTKGYTCQK